MSKYLRVGETKHLDRHLWKTSKTGCLKKANHPKQQENPNQLGENETSAHLLQAVGMAFSLCGPVSPEAAAAERGAEPALHTPSLGTTCTRGRLLV